MLQDQQSPLVPTLNVSVFVTVSDQDQPVIYYLNVTPAHASCAVVSHSCFEEPQMPYI